MANLLLATRESDSLRSENPRMSQPSRGLYNPIIYKGRTAVRTHHKDVRQAAGPQERGRKLLASRLEMRVGTRMAGLVWTRQAPAGAWGAATYALRRPRIEETHREHQE